MASKWQEVSLEDVASEITVGYVGTMAQEYVSEGVPFLRSLNIAPYRILFNDLKFISPEFHKRISKSRLFPGDLAVVRTGKPGTAAVIPEGLGQINCSDLVIIRPSALLDVNFLAYYLNSTAGQGAVSGRLVGSVQKHFNVGDAKTLRLTLPPIEEQRAIAHILGSLDDKIELNRRMNATLEEMARTLFKSWFVDFDPVRAKMEGRQPDGMDAETAALFPDRLVESELGLIPEGWEISQIGDQVQIVGGSTPNTEVAEYWLDGDIHWVTPKDLSNLCDPILLDTERKITAAGLNQISSRLLPMESILLSSRAPIGYLVITAIPTAINQGFIGMICNGTLPPMYVYHWTQQNMGIIKSRANGTTFMEISKKNFRPIPVLLPCSDILDVFNEATKPFYSQIQANMKEASVLAATRDTLLPKLLSGELRIHEFDKARKKPHSERVKHWKIAPPPDFVYQKRTISASKRNQSERKKFKFD